MPRAHGCARRWRRQACEWRWTRPATWWDGGRAHARTPPRSSPFALRYGGRRRPVRRHYRCVGGYRGGTRLQDASVTLEHPFEVVDFLSEEPSDYGISCVGSRGAVGMLDEAMLACTRADGETLAQGMRRIGANRACFYPPPG